MQLRTFFVIAVLILTSAFYVAGQTPEKIALPATASRIDFSATLGAVDPFSDSNFEEPKELAVRRGEVLVLRIQGTPKTGFHTYPITQRSENQDENGLSKITFKNNPAFSPIHPLKESEPEWKEEGVLGYFLEFEKPFTWTQEIYIQPDATVGKNELTFSIKLQVCDSKCVWGEHVFTIPVSVSIADPLEPSQELKQRLGIKEEVPKIVADPKSNNTKGNKQQTNTDNSKNGTEGLLAFALQGMFFGGYLPRNALRFPNDSHHGKLLPQTIRKNPSQAGRNGSSLQPHYCYCADHCCSGPTLLLSLT